MFYLIYQPDRHQGTDVSVLLRNISGKGITITSFKSDIDEKPIPEVNQLVIVDLSAEHFLSQVDTGQLARFIKDSFTDSVAEIYLVVGQTDGTQRENLSTYAASVAQKLLRKADPDKSPSVYTYRPAKSASSMLKPDSFQLTRHKSFLGAIGVSLCVNNFKGAKFNDLHELTEHMRDSGNSFKAANVFAPDSP